MKRFGIPTLAMAGYDSIRSKTRPPRRHILGFNTHGPQCSGSPPCVRPGVRTAPGTLTRGPIMRLFRPFLTALTLVFATTLLLPAVAGATSTTVTTNLYSSGNVSKDIASSCKDLSVASGTGVVSATCNHYRSSTSDEVDQTDSTYDIDDAVYCKCDNNGQTSASLAWGTGAGACTVNTFTANSWTLSLSSDGKNYILGGKCTRASNSSWETTTSLDLGDTTNGLKNSSGYLKAR